MNTQQRFDEIQTMLTYLDKTELLIDYTVRHRDRDGQLEFTINLAGTVKYVATIRSTHAYLTGAVDVAKHRGNTVDPLDR